MSPFEPLPIRETRRRSKSGTPVMSKRVRVPPRACRRRPARACCGRRTPTWWRTRSRRATASGRPRPRETSTPGEGWRQTVLGRGRADRAAGGEPVVGRGPVRRIAIARARLRLYRTGATLIRPLIRDEPLPTRPRQPSLRHAWQERRADSRHEPRTHGWRHGRAQPDVPSSRFADVARGRDTAEDSDWGS